MVLSEKVFKASKRDPRVKKPVKNMLRRLLAYSENNGSDVNSQVNADSITIATYQFALSRVCISFLWKLKYSFLLYRNFN